MTFPTSLKRDLLLQLKYSTEAESLRWYKTVGLFVFFCTIFCLHLFHFGVNAKHLPLDFKSFYLASVVLYKGGNFYDVSLLRDQAEALSIAGPVYPYLYSPLLATILYPLNDLHTVYICRVWLVINAFSFGILACSSFTIAYSLLKHNRATQLKHPIELLITILSVVGLFTLFPMRANLGMGQVNLLVIALVAASISFSIQNRVRISAFLLAISILLKFIPALVLLYFLFQRRMREIYNTVISLALLVGLSIATTGLEPWIFFGEFLLDSNLTTSPKGLFPLATHFNFSVIAVLERLFGTTVNTWLVLSVTSLFFIAYLWVIDLRSPLYSKFVEIVPIFPLMMFISPLIYVHHIVFIFPAAVVLLTHHLTSGKLWRTLYLLLLLTFVSVNFPIYYENLGPSFSSARVITSLNFFGLLLFYIETLYFVRRFGASDISSPKAVRPLAVPVGEHKEEQNTRE